MKKILLFGAIMPLLKKAKPQRARRHRKGSKDSKTENNQKLNFAFIPSLCSLRYLYILCGLLLSCLEVTAQSPITIEKNNFPLSAGPFHYTVADPKSVAPPKSGKNIAWDYTSLKNDSDIAPAFLLNFHNPFTSSKVAIEDTGKQEFLTSDNNYSGNYFYDDDNSGFYFSGDYVVQQGLSLLKYFNDSADSIFIPEQNDSLHLNLIGFPTTFGTSSHFNAAKSLRFYWTIKSAGLDSAPSLKKTYYAITDTVSGWGTLRVPVSGKKSVAYPTLLIRQKVISIDSYFVNGSPPSKFFLIAFGIVQGKKTVGCNEYFYRTGHQEPLMSIEFGSDTTYTTPSKVLYSKDSVKQQAGIGPGQTDDNSFALYPNPVTASQVACAFTKGSTAQWKILILNSLGQVFRSETIEDNGAINRRLNLNGAKAGLYLVEILDENSQVIANGKLSIIR